MLEPRLPCEDAHEKHLDAGFGWSRPPADLETTGFLCILLSPSLLARLEKDLDAF